MTGFVGATSMFSIVTVLALGTFATCTAGCGDGGETAADDDGSGAASVGGQGAGGAGTGGQGPGGGGSLPTLADPCQAGPAEDWWLDDGAAHTTPETAKVEGVVTEPVVYLEGQIDPAAGVYFFSFCTGPSFTTFDMVLYANDAQIDFVHVHDATGLVFGPEVPPATMTSPTEQSWTLSPDTPYVLEIHAPGGGFF